MPEPERLLKAELREITWDQQQQVQELDKVVPVQFNPETLKVAFSNQSAGGDQRGGSAIQFVGAGNTKLSFDLWFDATVPQADGSMVDDVRRLTKDVVYFITPKESGEEDKFIPPGVRFLWGTFLFEGIVDSVNENLEFFSEDAKPLRASISLSLSQQEIQFKFGNQAASGLPTTPSPGTEPLQQAQQGDTVQDVAGRQGNPEDWPAVAENNDVDNPRMLEPGTPLDARAR